MLSSLTLAQYHHDRITDTFMALTIWIKEFLSSIQMSFESRPVFRCYNHLNTFIPRNSDRKCTQANQLDHCVAYLNYLANWLSNSKYIDRIFNVHIRISCIWKLYTVGTWNSIFKIQKHSKSGLIEDQISNGLVLEGSGFG